MPRTPNLLGPARNMGDPTDSDRPAAADLTSKSFRELDIVLVDDQYGGQTRRQSQAIEGNEKGIDDKLTSGAQDRKTNLRKFTDEDDELTPEDRAFQERRFKQCTQDW
jgi:hypothetical protein